jgi:hypothetical protein
MPRRAARIDDNQNEIVKRYRELGATVAVTSAQHKGFPDIVVGYRYFTSLVEIKDGSKPKSSQKLTPDQEEFHENWYGDVRVVNCLEDVVEHLNDLNNAAYHAERSFWLSLEGATIEDFDRDFKKDKVELVKE